MDFRRSYPKIADFLEKKEPITRKNQLHSRWHWLTLILFGLLTVATFTQQIFLLLVSIVIVALLKGPGMIFLGTIYLFLGRLISTHRHRFVRYFFLTESGDISQKLATLINRILFLWLSDCCDVSKSLEKLGQYLVSHWELSHWLACAPPSPDKNLPTVWNR